LMIGIGYQGDGKKEYKGNTILEKQLRKETKNKEKVR
jgi:hypothetical protein